MQSVERQQEYQFGPLARRLSADSDDVRRAMVALDDAGDITVSAREGSWGIHVTGTAPQGRRRAAAAHATATAPRDPAHERRRRDARTSAAARALLQYLEEVGDHAAPDSTGVARPDELDDPAGDTPFTDVELGRAAQALEEQGYVQGTVEGPPDRWAGPAAPDRRR